MLFRSELDLRLGATDIPLIIQDRRLDPDGNPRFSPSRPERFTGYLGDQVLVNLTPRPHLDVASRVYRFRALNGSNSRIYRLAFRHGQRLLDFAVIGTDGGLLERPHIVREAFLSPAERLDVLLDLRYAAHAETVSLVSLPFDPMHQVEGHATVARHDRRAATLAIEESAIANGAEIELMRIQIGRAHV